MGDLVEPWGRRVHVYCCSSHVKAKRYWDAGSTGMLKKAAQRCTTVKWVADAGTSVIIVAGLGTTGAQGIT